MRGHLLRENKFVQHETYAYILDIKTRARSTIHKSREGTILTTLGDKRFTILEMLGKPDEQYAIGERIDIEKCVMSVLGKLYYNRLSMRAVDEIPLTIQKIVESSESRFVQYVNKAGLVTAQFHTLSVMPGVGKAVLKSVLERRDIQEFVSYDDISENTRWRNPAESIIQRIHDEVMGRTGSRLFARR